MARMPKLSICIPSRNRQIYFQSVIEAVLRSRREDVEFVFADNSDDPAIMNNFMKGITDPRVRYLPSQDKTLSMIDNWERTVAASSGEWVTVIGDDDHIDPEATRLIERAEIAVPDVDVIGWTQMSYTWPDGQPSHNNLFVPFKNRMYNLPRDILLGRILGWNDTEGPIPVSGMTIYHHLVRRALLDNIKTIYGRFFENPVVDYDSAIKNIVHGRSFLSCQRPFSVMGACPESNTYSVSRLSDMRKKLRAFYDELGAGPDEASESFPFRVDHGLTATIGQVIHSFKVKYGLDYGGWERNFVKACARNVEVFLDREDFDLVRDAYRHTISTWHGGKYLNDFNPVFKGDGKYLRATGFSEEGAYISRDGLRIVTPSAFYDFACEMMLPVDQIESGDMNLDFATAA